MKLVFCRRKELELLGSQVGLCLGGYTDKVQNLKKVEGFFATRKCKITKIPFTFA
ncbi:hypothetical protein Hanom_Chr04g00353661 [Helianthus anomalus]